MWLRLLTCVVVLSLGLHACKSKPPASGAPSRNESAPPVSMGSLESGILAEVNRHRRSKGLPELQSSSIIETEASMHSQAMASKRVAFGHDGFETRISRISKRLGGVTRTGENVAYGNMNARQVVQSWLKSAPHRKNIEGRYNLTGIGVSRDKKGVIYYTQLFAMKS